MPRNKLVRKHPDWRSIAMLMNGIEYHDKRLNYPMRNRLVLAVLGLAAASGLECGVRADPQNAEWPVVMIELPTGQVSWHLEQHKPWDGHTTNTKYERIHQFQEMMGVFPASGSNADRS